ncbi:hypothetical protein D0Z03_001717 [Geotrichum reessii]|nr:hypothetical protein D0Z03_001717 [Galactomyces reessii]
MLHDIGYWRTKLQEITASAPASAHSSGHRIAIMGENSYQFAVAFYASLTLPKTLAVPLCTNHTAAEIKYQLENSQASLIITPERFVSRVEQFRNSERQLHTFEAIQPADKTSRTASAEAFTHEFRDDATFEGTGYMLYTSGTSGNPKGVVTPLETFMAQAHALSTAWNINENTNFLHTLPLHHVHGVLIALTLPVLARARVEFLFPFNPASVLERLSTPPEVLPPINTYTAVPTIYSRLVNFIDEKLPAEQLPALQAGFSRLQLAMCGSAALPDPLRQAWDRVTDGQISLLERYGMTETGITLSQPLAPVSSRRPGTVGHPVPSVIARIISHDTKEILYDSSNAAAYNINKEISGDLVIGGPTVFKEYWNKPEATRDTFLPESNDGHRWFVTGDVASVNPEDYSIKILGRASMDIIKSGGEKLSALEIEREILGIPHVAETAVVGLPSKEWGEQATAIIVLKGSTPNEYRAAFDYKYLKNQLKDKLSGYKIPREVLILDRPIPRNQMGKVNKKNLVKTLFSSRI